MQSCNRLFSLKELHIRKIPLNTLLQQKYIQTANISNSNQTIEKTILYEKNSKYNKTLLDATCKLKDAKQRLRHFSSGTEREDSVDNAEAFRAVFRFPFTPIIVAICRAKIYMSGIVCLATPGLIYSALYQNLDYQYLYNFGACGFSVTTLILFGEFFRRCVGIVYINKDYTKVKLAHVTFWGRRNDVDVPLDDIIPLSETSEHAGKIFWKISFYENSIASKLVDRSELIICTRYGNIIDREAFIKIFGEETMLNPKK